jgi:membrane protein DedA with SNARE-associated domain
MEQLTQFFTQAISSFVSVYGLLGIFILMTAESALIPIPSEITMPFAGFLAGLGKMSFWAVVFVGAFGNLLGSLLAYLLGYKLGENRVRSFVKRWGKWFFAHEKDFDISLEWYKKYGQGVTFGSRLLPIVRTFISLPAGIARMNIYLFSFLTFTGSFLWSWVLVFLGFQLGQNWSLIEPYFRRFQYLIILIVLVGFSCLLFQRIGKKATKRG